LALELAAEVDVVTIYIVEAHPSDEWALNTGLDDGAACIRQPRNLTERMNAAASFATRYEYPTDNLVIDNMQNTLCQAYGAEPERLYVISDGKLAYCGGMGPYHYSPDEMRCFLNKTLADQRMPIRDLSPGRGLLSRISKSFSD